MKKTLNAAVALSVFAAPAYAANLENPLYMPKQNEIYNGFLSLVGLRS